ncbi:unnamed protein product [Rotaria magnacalcarata]|uniref:Pseudouridylate synthase RPUSD4, mitochondrial n=2 Tax=Rotaria magnacalcarata TaxID=392030 RepID=A0A816SD75_9BILA|nr:unnamed protein product [Rotaria magnacalcarata]CAF2127966.1 unnamed protein product [Rotaria magnacalcarata]CAF3816077.1 unnamed protein product [Rotaria magnacalcarata]CAF4192277.1 unnamed protein product [Rotaria magnacalcarata]
MNEKIAPKNDDTEFPPSHSKYVTHRAPFGQVRVDRPAKSAQRQAVELLYKNYDPANEENQKFDARIWSLVDEDRKTNEKDIDFYGLINAHYRNICFENTLSSPKEELSDNYIDQLAFPELTTKAPEIKSAKIKKETLQELKSEEMSFVDEQYFGTLKQIEHQNEQTLPTKRIEMPPKDELNYIDQLVFHSPTSLEEESMQSNKHVSQPSEKKTKSQKVISDNQTNASPDKLLDINFQYPIAASPTVSQPVKTPTPNNLNETPMDSYNPKLESIRSIKPKDYFDPPRQSSLDIQKNKDVDSAKTAAESAGHIREQLTKKINVRDSLGYRTFENLVPKWWTMTKAEIVDILIKQICFIRHGILALDKPYGGPGVQISIAHFIPQIIERLNNPEIKQLHLLHRLDKQSTGLLLMAYTPEAEQRLRQLMQERKVTKQYLTIVRGIPKPSEGEITIPIVERNICGTYKMMLSPDYNELTKLVMPKVKRNHIDSSAAITKYRVIDSNYGASLVECQPVTGVKHQIRTHLAHALGTPILGDHKYSHYAKLAPQKLPFATLKQLGVRQAKVRTIPLCLHSYSIAIPNFLHNQQNIFIRARLSHHLRYFIQGLRLRMIK